MTGRKDRKFCSAACRQSNYRTRNVTVPHGEVHPVQYDIADVWTSYAADDPFWELVFKLTDLERPPSRREDDSAAELDYDECPFGVCLGPIGGRGRKHPRPEDVETNRDALREFVAGYQDQRAMLDRMHATARALLERPEYQD